MKIDGSPCGSKIINRLSGVQDEPSVATDMNAFRKRTKKRMRIKNILKNKFKKKNEKRFEGRSGRRSRGKRMLNNKMFAQAVEKDMEENGLEVIDGQNFCKVGILGKLATK